jgi:hypothetical protein
MKNKLLFIMSDSETFLHDEAMKTFKKWGFAQSNVKSVEEWNPALVRNSVSLFGDVSMVHLNLTDKKKFDAFAELVKDKKKKELFEGNWFGPALLITSTQARGASKIEELIKNSGGEVQKKAKPAEMREMLLKRMNLNPETKEFLESFVGEDYQILISIANQLEKLTKEEQLAMTPEELAVRLPIKPGTVPPWDFINPMLEGNAKSAVELFERTMAGSHVLVTMLLARKKLQLLYRLKILQKDGVWKSQDQAAAVGEANGPNIWIAAKVAQKLDLSTIEYLAKLSLVTEANLKGHLNADPQLVFKNFIAAVCIAIRYNTSMTLNVR